MEKKTIVIISAVVILAVIVAAALIVLSGNDDDKGIEIPEVASGTGTVYGNADGNCYIDEVDIAIMESIISGERKLKDFPFADANCDGTVDETDIQWVRDMIDRKDMKVNVLDTQDNIVSVQYPIDNFIVLAGSNLAPLMNILDVSDKVIAAAYSTLDPIRDYSIDKGIKEGRITQLTTNGTAADMDAISKLDTKVMLTEYSGMYDLDSDENVATLNEWGIDVLMMECRDPGDDTRSMAVFGILLDRSDEAQSYIDFLDDVYDEIKQIEGDQFGKTTVMIASLTSSVSGKDSGYIPMIEMAGGKSLADYDGSTKKVDVGSLWILEEKYASDILFLGAASNYGGNGFSDSSINSYKERWSNHSAWKDGNAIMYSTSIPVICRVAYYAEYMYPEIFEDGWANSVHQRFIDTYFDTPFTVKEEQFVKNIST